ncbi:MAG: TetR/AcrR family transcriptional regulator [Candidatus Heimdallarchaeota archaeon]|nr:TetR/AcrR family transcriptional regulator [Candidatus Heimdallarchaeota archaeon]MCK4252860.1 TetR/AcrR family transcriptional regulator [Candidatus Heimdallarchaeota archaeon]
MGGSDTPPKFRRNKQEKIDLIVRTFLKLVEELGYSNVSTNMVASKADISIGTIYRYFPEGKAAILKEGFNDTIGEFMELADILKIIAENDYDLIKKFVSKYLKGHQDYLHLHEAYEQASLSNKEIFHSFQDNIKEYAQKYINLIKEKDSSLKHISTEKIVAAIVLIINVIESLIHHHLFHEPLFENDEDLIIYLTKLFQFTLTMYVK